MRKSGSAHSSLAPLDAVEPKIRTRVAKPPPPAKPAGLALRPRSAAKVTPVLPQSVEGTDQASRGSPTEHERSTRAELSVEIRAAPKVSRTPSNRSSRPRLAPPPPPPKKPNPPPPPQKPPRDQKRVSVVEPASEICKHQLSAQVTVEQRSVSPSAGCDEKPRPSAPTIPLPQPPVPDPSDYDGGEYECYERIDFCSDSQPSSERTETETEPQSARDRLSETILELFLPVLAG
ncbi:unnamed protein product [Nippostrongylus brasiliensis]|uniref:Extensin-like n=1 Tax=Nippostrongylus brasiliensis TaxID=27835 RepID=A0A0N4YW52_NIPBR|nr:unnamed protein product [Nippostrongylus brasiliensis]